MELRVLRYFLVVAQEENITKAAKLLHLTQPTLSRQIRMLEEEFGVALFRRSKYCVSLTEEGMLLRRRAQELLELAEKTERDMNRKNDVISGEIAIGCGETRNMASMGQAIAAFRQVYPEVQFSVYTGYADDVTERMERGLVDMGLLIEPIDISKYHFLHLPLQDQWGVCMREDHRLAGHTVITPADLAGENLLISSRQSVRNMLENWLGPALSTVSIAAYMNVSFYNYQILTKEGAGLSLLFMLDTICDGLCIRPMEPAIVNGSVLAWKKDQILSPAVETFIRWMRNQLGCRKQ